MRPPVNPRVESDHFLHQAIVRGDTSVVIDYLAAGGSPNVLDCYQCEPIYTAVKYDRLRIAKLLLAAGGNIHHHSSFRGYALGVSCWNWNIRMIHFCLRAGADLNKLDHGQTLLDIIANESGHFYASKRNLRRWSTALETLRHLGAKHATEL